MDTSNLTGLILLVSVVYIVINFFIIKAFFKMAEDLKIIKEKIVKNLKAIRESITKEPKVENLSIFKLLEGSKVEAIAEIKRSFIIECTLIIEKYNYNYDYDVETEVNHLISEYTFRYKIALKDEITHEYLTDIYSSIRNLFYGESSIK